MSIICPHGETTCANCYYCAVNKDRDATIARLQAEASSLQEQLRLARVARDSFESAMSASDAKGITPWRVGHKALRTLYDANDRLVGVVDTPDMATLVVEAVNAYWGTGVEPKVYPHLAAPSPETGTRLEIPASPPTLDEFAAGVAEIERRRRMLPDPSRPSPETGPAAEPTSFQGEDYLRAMPGGHAMAVAAPEPVKPPAHEACKKCGGFGWIGDNDTSPRGCDICGGTGAIPVVAAPEPVKTPAQRSSCCDIFASNPRRGEHRSGCPGTSRTPSAGTVAK